MGIFELQKKSLESEWRGQLEAMGSTGMNNMEIKTLQWMNNYRTSFCVA